MSSTSSVEYVVIVVLENHPTDNYFRGLAAYGANVASDWPLSPNPPPHDQPHDRRAYFEWLTGAGTATHAQFDTAAAYGPRVPLLVFGGHVKPGIDSRWCSHVLVLRDGSTLPPPNDAPLPQQPQPPR